ncbi:KCNT2-like protein [Mya arenaria]|uniref:KCNT2-like protein n=1 Tax=Mya arenaria TaxID=6604 RepID=A0ABY7F7E2_MYAAR|nr:KCNT2-like protein [Mya arenaria]
MLKSVRFSLHRSNVSLQSGSDCDNISIDDDGYFSAPVKYFEHDSIRGRLRRILIRNSTARLAFTVFDVIAKSLVCILYFVRVILDDMSTHVMLWVHRPMWLWVMQVVLSVITFVKGLLKIYIAKNDLHRTRQRFQTISVTLSQQCLILIATLFCMIFTTICGIQHIQRASAEVQLNMFDAVYFVIVTFSTVGYGDISPDIWPSQVERRAAGCKHVVVVSRTLQTDTVMDFLLEFYAHPKLEEHVVVLMASELMDVNMQVILKDPKWSQRVVYMRGSVLKDTDLKRCRIASAEACFILAPRYIKDRTQADQHTILRSWAVKDFAPKCKQYIQLFKPENKIHVKFAEHVVCEDEFKYALLANNCLYPGLSTLVSLLVHTSGGFEGELATDQWQQTYGRHSGNEIYHIQLERSLFFSSYVGKSFTTASAEAHQSYILKGSDFCFYMSVTKEEYAKIQPEALRQDDTKSTRAKNMAELQRMLDSEDEDEDYGEEESVFNTITIQQGPTKSPNANGDTKAKFHIDPTDQFDHIDGTGPPDRSQVLEQYLDMNQDEFVTGPPPVTLYVGSKRAICHLMRERRPLCCLEWGVKCSHCTYKNTNDERWTNQLIILAAEHACNGIYNFIVPLRPDVIFQETISYFPLVYWMLGSISSVDDLLKAGINKASHLVVVNKEQSENESEDTLADSETIVAVQTIFKLFPNANIITELNQASNMRFMHFRAHDEYSQKISDLERTFVKGYLITFVRLLLGIDAEENSGHLSSIRIKRTTLARYRTYGELYHALCSTTGEVPIALYRTDNQSAIKSASPASPTPPNNNTEQANGKKLTHHREPKKVNSQLNIQKHWNTQNPEREDISDLIRNRMKSLDLTIDDYCSMEYKKNDICYVILNPSPKRKLRTGDLVYVIQPSSMYAIPSRITRLKQNRRNWTPPLKRSGSDTNITLKFPDDANFSRDRTSSLSDRKPKKRFHIGSVET